MTVPPGGTSRVRDSLDGHRYGVAVRLESGDPWYFRADVGHQANFAVWLLMRDGLRVPPFDRHPDGDPTLRSAGLNAARWWMLAIGEWERRFPKPLGQRLEELGREYRPVFPARRTALVPPHDPRLWRSLEPYRAPIRVGRRSGVRSRQVGRPGAYDGARSSRDDRTRTPSPTRRNGGWLSIGVEPFAVLPQTGMVDVPSVLSDELGAPLGALGPRPGEQFRERPLPIEHGDHTFAVESDRGDPEHLTRRNTVESDRRPVHAPEAIGAAGMDTPTPLDPRWGRHDLLMQRGLGQKAPVGQSGVAAHGSRSHRVDCDDQRTDGHNAPERRLHDVETTARAFQETAVDQLGEQLVGVLGGEAKLRRRCDCVLTREHTTPWRDLQNPLEKAQCRARGSI